MINDQGLRYCLQKTHKIIHDLAKNGADLRQGMFNAICAGRLLSRLPFRRDIQSVRKLQFHGNDATGIPTIAKAKGARAYSTTRLCRSQRYARMPITLNLANGMIWNSRETII